MKVSHPPPRNTQTRVFRCTGPPRLEAAAWLAIVRLSRVEMTELEPMAAQLASPRN